MWTIYSLLQILTSTKQKWSVPHEVYPKVKRTRVDQCANNNISLVFVQKQTRTSHSHTNYFREKLRDVRSYEHTDRCVPEHWGVCSVRAATRPSEWGEEVGEWPQPHAARAVRVVPPVPWRLTTVDWPWRDHAGIREMLHLAHALPSRGVGSGRGPNRRGCDALTPRNRATLCRNSATIRGKCH